MPYTAKAYTDRAFLALKQRRESGKVNRLSLPKPMRDAYLEYESSARRRLTAVEFEAGCRERRRGLPDQGPRLLIAPLKWRQ